MVFVGVLGVNYKTAHLALREAIARAATFLSGERAVFFPHPTVLLSTCNRTEIYFSSGNLAEAHSDLLSFLRTQMDESFEQYLYSFFGIDCFFHLCRVTAGLESAILGETEIQRQVKTAYANARNLSSSLHYLFQKTLKVSKEVRSKFKFSTPTLYGALWRLAEWQNRQILLVGNSMINRGLISFLLHKGAGNITLCTREPSNVRIEGIRAVDRRILTNWQEYDVIVCAGAAEGYLIQGRGSKKQIVFDLGVPRNVDPNVGACVYHLEEICRLLKQKESTQIVQGCEALIWGHVVTLSRIYQKRLNMLAV